MSRDEQGRQPSSKLSVIVRTLFGLALLIVVVLWLEPARVFDSLTRVRRGPLVAAFGVQIVAKLIWAFRWQAILRANQIHRGFWELFTVTHIGLFFNTFLPSSVGGDVVRGFYASRGGREKAVVSYLTVVIERILGLATFAAMASAAAVVAVVTESTPLPPKLLISVAALGAVMVAGAVVLFLWGGWVVIARRLPIPERWVDDLSGAFDLFRRRSTPRFVILGSSVLLKLIGILTYGLCGLALDLGLPATVYFLVVPAASVASMLPVTLNGLGVREGVMVGLLTAFGAPRASAGAIALLGLAIITSFALLGGVFYVFYRRPEADG